MTETDPLTLRETMFRLCLVSYDGTFASGQHANNKFEADRIACVPPLRSEVASRVAGLVAQYEPDLLLSVPRGGDWLTEDIAAELAIDSLILDKDPAKNFRYQEGGEEIVRSSNRLVIIDDLFNEETNTTKVYNLPFVSERAVAAVAILRRNLKHASSLSIPTEALFNEHIPNEMAANDLRWQYV